MKDSKTTQAAQGTEELEEKLALACRILGTEGHDDLHLGHLSAREGDQKEVMFMKGRGLALHEVHAEDIVTIDFDYQKISGTREPHDELPIHIEIYRSRPDVHCVVHTHPLYATAFSATGQQIRAVNNEAAMFVSQVSHFDRMTDLIVTREQGQWLAEDLGEKNVLLLKNHGIVVVGTSIEEATVRSFLLEKTIKTLFVASVFGEFAGTDEGEAGQKAARMFTAPKVRARWEALRRRLEEKERPMRILQALEEKFLK